MTLEEVRHKIDAIDKELLRLLNERAECVNIVGEIKHRAGLEIYAPEREEKLLRKLVELNNGQQGRLPERSIRAIYREIMSAALALEHPLSIAYLGPTGSRTHQVALSKFGHGVAYSAETCAQAIFDRVASKQADYGVLPIEHSTQGAVHHTLDQFVGSTLQICAQMIVRGEDDARSRYIILGQRSSGPSGDDSTMLFIEVPDQVGALSHLLESFARHGVDVRMIESRLASTGSAGKAARFFLEVSGHAEQAGLADVIAELRTAGGQVKVLGSYPSSAWVEDVG
jgi:chorismate mutase-like protein